MTAFFQTPSARALAFVLCLFSAVTMHPASAARYIKPNQSKELFKLEKIPLQVDSMKELSKHLVVLSRRDQDDSAHQLRSTAQMLLLAILLDPANQDARKINRTFTDGNRPGVSTEAAILKAKAQLRFYNRWLGSTDAGHDANLLADLLLDATKILQAETFNNADIANWTDVVAPLNQYKKSGVNPKDDQVAVKGKENKTPDTAIRPPVGSKFYFTKMYQHTPLVLINSEKYTLPKTNKLKTRYTVTHGISTIGLILTPCKPAEKGRFTIKSIAWAKNSEKKDPLVEEIQNTLLTLITSRHGGLPDYNSHVLISDGVYARVNELALIAPLALMLESSIHNTPLREDVHICATLDATGKLSLSNNFWKTLAALRKNPTGGRLIVPTAAYELLAQMLVYGNPDFFTRWEILSADTLDEALAVATQKSSDNQNKAHGYFKTVQDLARKSDVTKIAVNHAVRSRLAEILQLAPNHLSSRILLLQGSGKRPMRLSEKALAHELLPIIKKMNYTLQHQLDVEKLSIATLKKIYEESRASIDKLAPLVDRSHDDLYQEALHQADECRRLMVIVRRRESAQALAKEPSQDPKAIKLFYTLQRDTEALLQKTLVTAGFPAPEIKNEDK